jgi:hypothetical protein
VLVEDVMQALADRADTITGLRCFGYPIDSTPPIPAFIVSYPDTIDFDRTYGRGMDAMTIGAVVLVGRVTDRATRAQITKYLAGSGPESIKAVIESGTYTAFDTVRVARVTVDVVRIGTVDYLAATLTHEITGQGAS